MTQTSRPQHNWAPDDDKPPPDPGYIRKVLGDLWEGLFPLIVWTFLIGLVSIPAFILVTTFSVPLGLIVGSFTFAPALTGLFILAGDMARGGFARLGNAFSGTWKLYWRSVALSVVLALFVSIALLTARAVQAFPDRREMIFPWALQIGVTVTLLIVHIYLLPVLALFKMSLMQTVQISLLLCGRYILQTIVLLATAIALAGAVIALPMIGLLAPSVWAVVIANATWRLMRRTLEGAETVDK